MGATEGARVHTDDRCTSDHNRNPNKETNAMPKTTARDHITRLLIDRPDLLAIELRDFAAAYCADYTYATVRKAVKGIAGVYTCTRSECDGARGPKGKALVLCGKVLIRDLDALRARHGNR